MSEPLAFLLTFRTYGTWLHGDERGSVDRDHNGFREPYVEPNSRREHWVRFHAKFNPTVFDEVMREVVGVAFAEECAFRGWELLDRNVRTNHAHVVVGYAELPPEKMAGHLKSRATRVLRLRGPVASEQPVWVDGPGSRRYLWRLEGITAAIEYVHDRQDASPG